MSFAGARSSSCEGKLGLAFVAWTRAERWERMAFHKLPPLDEFIAVRLTREFDAGQAFECTADAMFVSCVERCGTSLEMPTVAREEHLKQALQQEEHRDPSHAEVVDLRAMLAASGVKPVSDSVSAYCAQKSGRKSEGLWGVVASFRAEKTQDKGSAPEGCRWP